MAGREVVVNTGRKTELLSGSLRLAFTSDVLNSGQSRAAKRHKARGVPRLRKVGFDCVPREEHISAHHIGCSPARQSNRIANFITPSSATTFVKTLRKLHYIEPSYKKSSG